MVMDVLNIQNGQKSLERLADLLAKIQKALGEYLERERASFPRFYFVGDEDLLEIIGNTKNIPRYLCTPDSFLEYFFSFKVHIPTLRGPQNVKKISLFVSTFLSNFKKGFLSFTIG